VGLAKALLKSAGYTSADPRFKRWVLLHTQGPQTIAIAQTLQENLKKVGISLNLQSVDYSEQDQWQSDLKRGSYTLFLMGFKAEKEYDPLSLLWPLFHRKGSANFTGYRDPITDQLLDSLTYAVDETIRLQKLEVLQRRLYREVPVVGLFYIEKL
jgi:ABC-type transport system substrate-binding protein